MSIEPGVLDANILMYAVEADAPQHAISRALIEAARGPARFFISRPRCSASSIPS
jgi:predicted nucleic acid-binding protein